MSALEELDAEGVAEVLASPARHDAFRAIVSRGGCGLPDEVVEAMRAELHAADLIAAINEQRRTQVYASLYPTDRRPLRKALDVFLGEGAHAAFVGHLYDQLRARSA